MLHSLQLENFKAFGERARIPFAPITLIFGENSAGKSSILQALNLLKQTRENREFDALLLPKTESGVDLGSFYELIFNHDLKRILSVCVEPRIDKRDISRIPYIKHISIEFNFKRLSSTPDIILDQIRIYDCKSSKCIAEFQPLDPTEKPKRHIMRISHLRYSRGLPPSKLDSFKCVAVTEKPEYWETEFEWSLKNKNEIVDLLNKRFNDLKHSNKEFREDNDEYLEEYKSLKDDIDFFSADYDLKTYIAKRLKEEMNAVLAVQGFLPVGIISQERNTWTTVIRSLSPRFESRIFDIAHLTIAAAHALDRTLEVLFPMGPFRRPPERLYIFRGTSPQDVGYRGDLLPDLLFRRPELVQETNKWLERLEIGYELDVKSIGPHSGDLFEVRLIDTRRKEPVNVALPDVGFGISQLLPFVVQSLVSEKRIISIEQPEVHVHPKLQADLGDLLAEAIKKPRQNQFIVETHSEHLILRLQRLVRENKIKPKDVSVIYVSRGPEGAISQRLRLDEEGDFIDEWPDGFFPERLRELR